MSLLKHYLFIAFAICLPSHIFCSLPKNNGLLISHVKEYGLEKNIIFDEVSVSSVNNIGYNQPFVDVKIKKLAKLGFYFLLWYSTTIVYNISNKRVLNVVSLPITVATIQLFFGFIIFLPIWSISLPNLNRKMISPILRISLLHGLGNIATVISLGAGAVSFTHVVKASEPCFAAIFTALLLGCSLPWQIYLTLVPIIYGVGMASLTEVSFNWLSLSSALLSNVFNQLRIVLAKKELSSNNSLSGAMLFRLIVFFGAFLMLPIALIAEGPKYVPLWSEVTSSKTGIKPLMIDFVVSGLSYYISNEV